MTSRREDADLARIAEVLQAADNIVLCGHVSPDGDCIGSQLALAAALHDMGKRATCLLVKDEPIDFGLRFLPGASDMVVAESFHGECDLFVTLDVPTLARMGDAASQLHAKASMSITLDHHPSQQRMSQLNYIDTNAAACALIVWKLIALMNVQVSADVATCCYTGTITDTGRFQYQNTNVEVLECAASMVGAGANPAQIAAQVYQNRSRASLSLEARALDRMQILCGGEFAVSYLLRSDFVEAGAEKSDAEPLIDVIRSIRGIRVACILRQQISGVRGSLRAKDDTDVAQIAARLGGGGHKAAAGFTLDTTIDRALDLIYGEFDALQAGKRL